MSERMHPEDPQANIERCAQRVGDAFRSWALEIARTAKPETNPVTAEHWRQEAGKLAARAEAMEARVRDLEIERAGAIQALGLGGDLVEVAKHRMGEVLNCYEFFHAYGVENLDEFMGRIREPGFLRGFGAECAERSRGVRDRAIKAEAAERQLNEALEATKRMWAESSDKLKERAEAAEAERDRLARERWDNMSKWLGILGQPLTPTQPECATLIDMALKRLAAIDAAREGEPAMPDWDTAHWNRSMYKELGAWGRQGWDARAEERRLRLEAQKKRDEANQYLDEISRDSDQPFSEEHRHLPAWIHEVLKTRPAVAREEGMKEREQRIALDLYAQGTSLELVDGRYIVTRVAEAAAIGKDLNAAMTAWAKREQRPGGVLNPNKP